MAKVFKEKDDADLRQTRAATSAGELLEHYDKVRSFTESLASLLTPEDCVIQSMPDASPTKWHLAHTSWFFETFVLSANSCYKVFNEPFSVLFNSYYNSVGEQFSRPHRGLLSRPGLQEVLDYRSYVDENMRDVLQQDCSERTLAIIELGLHHEQQHQELILTDIKHALSCNPLEPIFRPGDFAENADLLEEKWSTYEEGVYEMGHTGNGFAFDNESPRHRVFLDSFELAPRPVTCGEFLAFMEDDGYQRPELWLSLGWTTCREQNWQAPFYWRRGEAGWTEFTLAGRRSIQRNDPVCHVSYYEADAFARWAKCRLPTEAEWEIAAVDSEQQGTCLADQLWQKELAVHPNHGSSMSNGSPSMMGGTWEWTSSSYAAYPGYQAPAGALGEYNGKFMCNQYVLRGGSCATPTSHLRATYRNFFPPQTRWQFSGIRLCRSM